MDQANCHERIRPWSEVIGTVEKWGGGTITVCVKKQWVVLVGDEELKRWESMLQRGSKVGILILDDGRIRLRRLEAEDG